MEARKIAVKLRRDPRETAERHSQANPLTLECTLASGEVVTETMELRAELHAAQTPQTTPLAATAAVTMTTGSEGPWELEFTGAQMNQTVLPDSSEDFWLVVYATNADDDLFTLAKMALTLTFDNVSQVTPSPPDPALFLDLGGTQWKLAEDYVVDDIVALDGSIYVCTADNTSTVDDEPGVGQEWESFWVLFSGGGGGTTNLGATASPTQIIITSDTGTDATIPAADGTNAGLMLPAQVTKLAGIATGATANSSDSTLLARSNHTGTQAISTIVNLQTTLDGKALTTHTHSIADVTGLQSALDGKAETSSLGDLAFVSSVGASLIDTGAVTEAKIADGAVTATKIAAGAVGPTQLATDAVTTTKIINAAVTNAKLANANAATIKSNLTGSPAAPQDNSVEDVAAALPVFASAQRGMVPAPGAGTNARMLLASGAWSDTLAFGTLTASDPFVITQTWNNAAVVFTGLDMVITQTAANSSSYFLRFRGGSSGTTDRFYVLVDGTTISASGAGWFSGACGLSSGGAGFYLNDAAARIQLGSSAASPNFYRDSDGGMGLRNATSAQASRVYDTFGSSTDYHRVSIASVRASLSALSGAIVTAAALIPAGAIVVGVTAKVLTAVTGATSWQLGTAADPDRFAASGGTALGSTTDNRNWTSGALECFLAATDVVLTANGSNFTGGAVYISVQYIRGEAD